MGEQKNMMSSFPDVLIDLFRNHGIDIYSLPKLDLKKRQGNTDYIDFIYPKDMTHSVMQFKDILGRYGIAFNLELIDNDITEMICKKVFRDPKQIRRENVFVYFQRYGDDGDNDGVKLTRIWKSVWGCSDDNTLQFILNQYHDMEYKHSAATACENCPFTDIVRLFIPSILSDVQVFNDFL